MIFKPTALADAYLIEIEKHRDERGFFGRSWCQHEFSDHGLAADLRQCSVSYNAKQGTLRGMHYQLKPFEEAKLVRCTRGAIYDVIVDMRPDSASFKQHVGYELSADNHYMLYVPEGFAHGFITLADDTEVFYQMNEFYAPDHSRGFRWNDPQFNIHWPVDIQVISARDQQLPDFTPLSN